MTSQQLEWNRPGVCPSCGVVTDRLRFRDTGGKLAGAIDSTDPKSPIIRLNGSQGRLLVSVCMSDHCHALALWICPTAWPKEQDVRLVYPQTWVRIPPADGLTEEETRLYREAAAVAAASPRAACALIRVLLEAFLKRHLAEAGELQDQHMPLSNLIETAVTHLALSQPLQAGLTAIRRRGNTAVHDPYGLEPWLFHGDLVTHLALSQPLQAGLTAIRRRGNTAVHDPYGLTDDTRADNLPWLFQAVDDLVDDLHAKPQKWASIAGS